MDAMILRARGAPLEWAELPDPLPGTGEIRVRVSAYGVDLLWNERQLVSVANLTRQDGLEFLALAARIGIKTRITPYRLADANRALADLSAGRFDGAAVLVP